MSQLRPLQDTEQRKVRLGEQQRTAIVGGRGRCSTNGPDTTRTYRPAALSSSREQGQAVDSQDLIDLRTAATSHNVYHECHSTTRQQRRARQTASTVAFFTITPIFISGTIDYRRPIVPALELNRTRHAVACVDRNRRGLTKQNPSKPEHELAGNVLEGGGNENN